MKNSVLTTSKEGEMWMSLHLESDLVQVLGHLVGLSVEVQKDYISVDRRKSLQNQAGCERR